MKKVDLLTVAVSSTTLVLFCFCSYFLLWQYSKIRDDIEKRRDIELITNIELIEQIENGVDVNLLTLTDQLEVNIRAIRQQQQEWALLKETLYSFVNIMLIIVVSHLVFVLTLMMSKGRKKNTD